MSYVIICVRANEQGYERVGTKVILAEGFGINEFLAKDRKNKAKIDKVRGWSEAKKMKGK